MRTFTTIGVALWMALFASNGTSQGQTLAPESEIYREIAARYRAWDKALIQNDADAQDEILADSFIGTSGNGVLFSKKDAAAGIRSGEETCSKSVTENLELRASGDVVVATGLWVAAGTSKGKAWSGPHHFTETWLRQDGKWMTIASHVSRIDPADSEQPKPGPEAKKLQLFVGEWNYQGEGYECPFGPPGKFEGKTTGRLILGGFFLESRWKDITTDGFVAEGLVLHWYDTAAKTYREAGYDFDGVASMMTCKFEGDHWISIGTRADKMGKIYQTRFVSEFSPDGRTQRNKAEYSSDQGRTWKPWYTLSSRKSD